MMITSIPGILSYSLDTLDPDVRAFVNATSITDITIRSALNTFVLTLKTNGLWSRFDAIYPFVGGNAFTHKFNLKNPLDSNAAFRLVFSGGYLHNNNGITPAPNGFANTFYNESTNSLLNDKHISTYSRTNLSALHCDMGVFDGVSIATDIIPRYNSGGDSCFVRNSSTTGFFFNTDSRGYFLNNRPNSTQIRGFKNTTLNIINSTPSSLINGSYYINATNSTGVATFRSIRNISFASIGRSFSDAEAVIVYNAVQAMQTTLSRAV